MKNGAISASTSAMAEIRKYLTVVYNNSNECQKEQVDAQKEAMNEQLTQTIASYDQQAQQLLVEGACTITSSIAGAAAQAGMEGYGVYKGNQAAKYQTAKDTLENSNISDVEITAQTNTPAPTAEPPNKWFTQDLEKDDYKALKTPTDETSKKIIENARAAELQMRTSGEGNDLQDATEARQRMGKALDDKMEACKKWSTNAPQRAASLSGSITSFITGSAKTNESLLKEAEGSAEALKANSQYLCSVLQWMRDNFGKDCDNEKQAIQQSAQALDVSGNGGYRA